MKQLILMMALGLSGLLLQGCVHKVVTTPVKIAYKTTKGVAKGTAAVVRAVVPGDGKKDKD